MGTDHSKAPTELEQYLILLQQRNAAGLQLSVNRSPERVPRLPNRPDIESWTCHSDPAGPSASKEFLKNRWWESPAIPRIILRLCQVRSWLPLFCFEHPPTRREKSPG